MDQIVIDNKELINSGTSKTNNEEFDDNGFLFLKQFVNIEQFVCDPPSERGTFFYDKKSSKVEYVEETQCNNALERNNHPKYNELSYIIKNKVENIIGKKIYPTYYFDRFYFPDSELSNHVDSDFCEISVTINISSNLSNPWPLYIKKCDYYQNSNLIKGDTCAIISNPGDAVLYKGCERPHYRKPLPKEYERTWYGRKIEKQGLYYHQVFFHYVLSDGIRCHLASSNNIKITKLHSS